MGGSNSSRSLIPARALLADRFRRTLGHTAMPKIEDEILAQFFQELEKTEGFSKERVDNLRALFKAGKKLKATDFVKVLSEPSKEQLP